MADTESKKMKLPDYTPLDPWDPVRFLGDFFLYHGNTVTLSSHALYVDGSLSDETVSRYPYVYNTFFSAAKAFRNGTQSAPMNVYLAPYVYWVDNPDDPNVKQADSLVGMEIHCEWLRFLGLTKDPRNVVICGNRGQQEGADGNWTLFDIHGDGLCTENVTFANYCNVDLEYPLKPGLNRPKRSEVVTQAQLFFYTGDKAVARNCNFISRLNLLPFSGTRTLYRDCHFECTDDSISPTAVYLDCNFDFYGGMPAGSLKGAVFLNCDFHSRIEGKHSCQYLSKTPGPGAMIDCRFYHSRKVSIDWTPYPPESLRCYDYNVSFNGKPAVISPRFPWLSVNLAKCPDLLGAYKICFKGKAVYNVYNLLRGKDGWDPTRMKDLVKEASKADGIDYASLPIFIKVTPASAKIESGKTTARFQFSFLPEQNSQSAVWSVDKGSEDIVKLIPDADNSVTVEGKNMLEETRRVILSVRTESGLQSAGVIDVSPEILSPPEFIKEPSVSIKDGKAKVTYELDLNGRTDRSQITWYRCKMGDTASVLSVTRIGRPEDTYRLSSGDIGYFLMAEIQARHVRSGLGRERFAFSEESVKPLDILERDCLETDFHSFPAEPQTKIAPGLWTVDCYRPSDIPKSVEYTPNSNRAWIYGAGIYGASGTGLLQNSRGARLLYSPGGGVGGDMSIRLVVDPEKTIGQGFGSATSQYFDICIQFDTMTLTGYALRFERTSQYANAVEVKFVAYRNGTISDISEAVPTSVFMSRCTIHLKAKGNRMSAEVSTSGKQSEKQAAMGLSHRVTMNTQIIPYPFGGIGIQHTGTAKPGNRTMLHYLGIKWGN